LKTDGGKEWVHKLCNILGTITDKMKGSYHPPSLLSQPEVFCTFCSNWLLITHKYISKWMW